MKLLLPLLILLAGLATAVMLDSPEPPADITIVNRSEVFTLDPQRMSWMQDFRMAYALYESLVRWDNDDFSIQPAAAAALPEVSDDQLTYRFTIRDDARWSNGAPVTSHDFIYSWKRALLPDTAADYSMLFYSIKGGEDYFHWRQDQLTQFANQNTNATAEEIWQASEERFDQTVGLRAIDHHTLEVTLAQPTPYFLDLVAFGVFYPVYRPAVEGWILDNETETHMITHGWHTIDPPPFDQREFVTLNDTTGRFEQQHGWTKPDRLINNGPYILTRWQYQRGMRLERNEHYHTQSILKNDSVRVLAIEEPNTAVLAFERGEIDWLSDVSTDYEADMIQQRLAYESRYQSELNTLIQDGESIDSALAQLPEPGEGERRNIHVLPTFGTDFYSFNCRPTLANGRDNPIAQPAIRRALVQAIDRSVVVSQVTRLNEPTTNTFVPPGSIPGYESPVGLSYDPDAARQTLADAGWIDRDGDGVLEDENGMQFPTIDLLYSTNTPRYKNISLVLRDMWQRELDLEVVLRGKENKTFKEDLKSGNYMIARGRWYGDYGDPTTFLNIHQTGDGNNDRGYSNEYVDSLLAQAAVETDAATRMSTLAEIERYLFQEDPPIFVICNLVQLYMYDPTRLRGLSRHPRLTQYLWELERVDDE